MSVYENLKNDYKKFMVEKNIRLKECVQLVLSGIKQIEVDKRVNATDNDCISVIKHSIKEADELIEFAYKNKRDDIVYEYAKRKEYLSKYLPKMMSKEEVRKIVCENLKDVKNLNKGSAMKMVMPILKGKADGKVISEVVEEELNGTKK